MKSLLVLFLAPLTVFGYTFDRNVPVAVKDQIVRDLGFMSEIQGGQATGLHSKIFGTVEGKNYKKFIEDRVTTIGMNACGGGKAVACVIPWLGSSRIWMTENYVKFDHPQIAKMMVVYHEARHTETNNGNWSHATCPTPFLGKDGEEIKSIWTGATLAGEPACDETPLGSYGSSTILLKNIQKFCTNCSEKVRTDAGIYSDDQFKRIVDDSAKEEMQKDFGVL